MSPRAAAAGVLVLALAGCKALLNKDFTHQPAPPIAGGTWIAGKAPEHEWWVVTFFAPDSERSIGNVPRLLELRKEFGPHGVAVIAITRASAEDAKRFAKEHGADYEIEADGAMAFEKWGIGSADHAPVYLVDPNNRVLAEGFEDCAEILRERLGSPGAPRDDMARNVEIKARIESVEALARRARALADRGPEEIVQDDTFFRCEAGRLKLRAFPSGAGELIFYRRPDEPGPKESFYVIAPVPDAGSLRRALSLAYGEAGRVRKTRTLYLVGRTRIHLDRVEGLGDFLELEVVLSEGEPARLGVEEAEGLMARLGVDPARCVEGAYVDLLPREGGH